MISVCGEPNSSFISFNAKVRRDPLKQYYEYICIHMLEGKSGSAGCRFRTNEKSKSTSGVCDEHYASRMVTA